MSAPAAGLRLGEGTFPNLTGAINFTLNHERRWTLTLAAGADALVILDDDEDEPEPMEKARPSGRSS